MLRTSGTELSRLEPPQTSCCTRVVFATIAVAATIFALAAAVVIAGQYLSALSILPQILGVYGSLEVACSVLGVSLALAAPTFYLSCRALCSRNKGPSLPPSPSLPFSTDQEKVVPSPPTEGDTSSQPSNDDSSELHSEDDKKEPPLPLPPTAVSSITVNKPPPVAPTASTSATSPPSAISPISEKRVVNAFSYEQFSTHDFEEGVKEKYSISWTHHSGAELTWIQFLPKKMDLELQLRMNKAPKVHISINRGAENMAKAFAIIFPLLVSREIQGFKIIPQHMLEKRLGNPEGKEFVIYLLEDREEMLIPYQTLFQDILRGLRNEGVIPGKPSSGDVAIPGGEGFFYTRAPANLFGQYIAADFLQNADFTRYESAHISDSLAFRLRLGGEEKPREVFSFSPLTQQLTTISNPRVGLMAEIIQQKFFVDLTMPCNETSALYILFFGSAESDEVDGALYEKAFDAYTARESFLKEQLARAAKLSAAVYFSLGIDPLQRGNILPAIYYHFLVQWKQRESEGVDRALFSSNAAEKRFIIEVVKCSLRIRGGQIDLMEPQFQVAASDAAWDLYIQQLYSYGEESKIENVEGKEKDLQASQLTASLSGDGWTWIAEEDPDFVFL